jgi:hypothetical protein
MTKRLNFKNVFSGLLLAAGLACTPIAHASLTASEDGKFVYDSDQNITWLADANYSQTSGFHSSGNMNWDDAANNWTADLDAHLPLGNNSNWRLPTVNEMQELRHDLGGTTGSLASNHNANYNLFSNLPYEFSSNATFWTSTIDPSDTAKATAYNLNSGASSLVPVDTGLRAMAVTSVPEPETYAMLLAGLGLVSLVERHRKKIS